MWPEIWKSYEVWGTDLGRVPLNVKIISTWYEINMKITWKCNITYFLHSFHIIVILFPRDLGLGPKATVGRARARPLPPLWALRLGPSFQRYKTNMEIIANRYENNVIWDCHMIYRFVWYYFHIVFTYWGWGPIFRLQTSYCFHIPVHIICILFSYLCGSLVWGLFPSVIFVTWASVPCIGKQLHFNTQDVRGMTI